MESKNSYYSDLIKLYIEHDKYTELLSFFELNIHNKESIELYFNILCEKNNCEFVEYLINKYEWIGKLDFKPIILKMVSKGNLDILKLFLKFNIDICFDNNYILYYACMVKNLEITEFLLSINVKIDQNLSKSIEFSPMSTILMLMNKIKNKKPVDYETLLIQFCYFDLECGIELMIQEKIKIPIKFINYLVDLIKLLKKDKLIDLINKFSS